MAAAGIRKTVAGFFFKALSSPLEKGCRLLVVLIVAPALGAAAFGTYQFATSVAALLTAASGFGLSPWTTRALARDASGSRLRAIVSTATRLRVAAVLPYLVLLALVAWREDPGDARRAMIVLGVAALAHSSVDLGAAILRGREDFRREATMNAVRAVSTTLAALAGFFVTRTLGGLVAGIAVGSLASAAWGFGYVRRAVAGAMAEPAVDAPARDSIRDALREAGPLWLTGLLATLYFRTDILFVRYFAGEGEVGTYAAAYRIFEATMVLPGAVMHVAFPRLARRTSARRSDLELPLTALLVGLGGVVALGLMAADAGIVRVILGPTFERSAAPLRVLAFTVPVMFASYAVSDCVLARGRERWLVVVLGAMLALNVTLNLFTVPRLGGTGAAWSTFLTEVAFVASCVALLVLDASRAKVAPLARESEMAR